MNTFKLKLAVAALALGGFVTTMTASCNKKTGGNPDNSIRHSIAANSRFFSPGSRPGGLWYLGTPYMGGCSQPCGNFCHAEPWNSSINLNGEMQEYGPAYYTLSGNKLVVEVDMTHVNTQHLNEIVSSGSFNVPVTSELPYQSIVQAYNNAGITSNIPHYNMPEGPHDVALNNTGASVKVLTVIFTPQATIDNVSLEY